MANLTLLAIDDEPLVLEAIKQIQPPGWILKTALNDKDIPSTRFHAALVDLHLTNQVKELSGLKIIETLSKNNPHLEIIAMSGDLRQNIMEAALKAGASRFIAKPLHAQELLSQLEKIEALVLLRSAQFNSRTKSLSWLGDSDASDSIRKQIAQLRGEPGPILIEGESGTGKEVITQLLHMQEDSNRPFVSLNVSAIPENLFESELFGHTRGAFTGADQNRMGLIEAAHDGDLFLDEIEALPMSLQPKLLRFLESGETRKVGATQSRRVETRVIVASNEKLEDKVKRGEFREDLLWRLAGKRIHIPPLRERTEDIIPIAKSFLQKSTNRKLELSPEAIKALKKHSWPGNVRELKRVIESLMLTAPMPILREEDILNAITPDYRSSAFGRIDLKKGLQQLHQEFERELLSLSMREFPDTDEAAKALGISRSTYYQKLKDHSLGGRL